MEILLDKKGLCNLTTINVAAFIKGNKEEGYYLDVEGLYEAQRISAKSGVNMTLVELELKGENGELSWNEIQARDRLIGTSLTGWKDTMEILGYSVKQENELLDNLRKISRKTANDYAKFLRIPTPLLATTVKPEGTLSQVARNPVTDSPVSSGLHYSHSPYFIRRIRINANDPLAQVARALNWNVNPEVGTEGETYEEKMENASTWVIDFPVNSGAKRTKDDISVEEQFETYFSFQNKYTEHNSSNTITIKDKKEWEKAEEIVWKNWDNFVGVSFLQLDGGTYDLAPYQKISKEEYLKLKQSMNPFDVALLHEYEKEEVETDIGQESCESGICPIR